MISELIQKLFAARDCAHYAHWATGNVYLRQDGTQVGTAVLASSGTSENLNSTTAYMGASTGGNSEYLSGSISEFILYNTDKSSIISSIETNIRAYHGIS